MDQRRQQIPMQILEAAKTFEPLCKRQVKNDKDDEPLDCSRCKRSHFFLKPRETYPIPGTYIYTSYLSNSDNQDDHGSEANIAMCARQGELFKKPLTPPIIVSPCSTLIKSRTPVSLLKRANHEEARPNKRPRTIFSDDSLIKLRQAFKSDPNPDKAQLAKLAEALMMDEHIIAAWYKNQRLREKKQEDP